jgi:hypothetical protein
MSYRREDIMKILDNRSSFLDYGRAEPEKFTDENFTQMDSWYTAG